MNFRIQHLQWAGSIGVVAVCVAMAIITTVPKLSDYVDAQRTMSEFSKLNAVLTAAYAVSAERGPANNFMSATGSARDEYRDALVAARARTDASLSKVADLLPRDAAPSSEAVADFEMAKALLAKGRHDVDAAKIDSDRGKGVEVAAAIEAMFSAADKMQDLGNDVGRTVIASDPAVGVDVISATAASGLREHAGRLGSYVVMLLVSGSGTGSPYLTAFHSEMARVHDLYALLSNYASGAVSRNDVSSALLAVQKSYFGGSLVYASRVVDGLDTGRVPSSTDFTISYVPGMMATDTLRSAILSNGMRTASDSQANALRTVLVSFLLSATAIAVMIGVAWTAHRVLFQPLLLVRLQIDEIAAGKVADDSETVYRAGGVEIREIIKGLAFLRGQLRRKNELEAERQAMADELKRQSNTDALTGLLNRRALGDRVEALFSKRELQGAGVGVIIFDVDHFKSINDRPRRRRSRAGADRRTAGAKSAERGLLCPLRRRGIRRGAARRRRGRIAARGRTPVRLPEWRRGRGDSRRGDGELRCRLAGAGCRGRLGRGHPYRRRAAVPGQAFGPQHGLCGRSGTDRVRLHRSAPLGQPQGLTSRQLSPAAVVSPFGFSMRHG